jgi:type II secretory pathway pseudopilin PulG
VNAFGIGKAGEIMNRRTATTLTEVLVAIFIMGIGLMAILSLFPLGAAQMAQALKDQRSAEAAANASALARVIWKQACDVDSLEFGAPNPSRPAFRESTTPKLYPRSIQRFVYAMDDPLFNDKAGSPPDYPKSYPGPTVNIPPVTGFPPTFPGFVLPINAVPNTPGNDSTGTPYMFPMPLTGPDADRSSYPVLVDMFGWAANSSVSPTRQYWVGQALPQPPHNKVGLIPRRPLFAKDPANPAANADWAQLGLGSFASTQRIMKQFSLTDDMTFTDDGRPADSGGNPAAVSGGAIERQGRYSWAYLFKRVRNSSQRTQADISIIVYSGRSIDVPTDENSFYALSQPGSRLTDARTLRLAYAAGNKPALRRGQWVLDATIFQSDGSLSPQGRFYRVVNVEESQFPTTTADNLPLPTGSPTLSLEVQTPIAIGPDPNPSTGVQNPRIFVVMSNVVEVFTIGEVSQTKSPRLFNDDQDY